MLRRVNQEEFQEKTWVSGGARYERKKQKHCHGGTEGTEDSRSWGKRQKKRRRITERTQSLETSRLLQGGGDDPGDEAVAGRDAPRK